MQKKKGFTLLEILLVVGIIAILAGIVIIAINPGKQLATVRNTQRKNDLKQIYNAMTQFYIDKGQYPDPVNLSPIYLKEICNTGSVSNTATSTTGVACGPLVNLSALVPTYLTAIPVDPSGASSTMAFIPTAYAKSNGTGYRIMKTTSNQIVDQAPLAELGNQILLGTIPWTPISGLVAHYKLNDTDGTNVVDSSGNGHDGSGSYTPDSNGKIGRAIDIDGSQDITMNGIDIDSYDGGLSYGGWIKWDGVVRGWDTIFGWDQNGDWGSTYIWVTDGHLGYRFGVGNSSGYHDANYAISPHVWYHVFATHDLVSDKLYVNGVLVNESPSGTLTNNVDYFKIGSVNVGSLEYFGGSVDDVRIYDKALSIAEVAQIYNSGSGTESEVGSNLARIYYTPPSTKPTNVSVENVGDGSSLKVSFDLVPDATSYKVTCTDQWGYGSAGSATSDNSPITVGGLNDGWPYNCVVKAINDGGSISSDPVGIYVGRAPSSPNYVSATAGYESATVSFMYPWDWGDDYNISYKITTIPETTTTVVDASYGYPGPPDWNTGIPVTLSGLTGGTTYTIVVTAMNSYGSGPSAYSNQVTPIAITIPDTIQNVSASAKDSSARVSWSPSNTLVSYYTVSSHSSQDATVHQETSANPSALVTGLINGDTYTFTVTASNYKGTSNPSSPSSPVVPQPFVFASSANLVAHYKMNDNAGNTVVVDSAESDDGTATFNTADNSVAGVSASTTPVSGHGALSFNGGDNYIPLNSNFGLGGTNKISISVWVKDLTCGDFCGIFSDTNDDSNDLVLGYVDGILYFFTDSEGLGAPVNFSGWHHIVAVYDGSYLKLYYDGVELTTPVSSSVSITSENFVLGLDRSIWGRFMNGSMDDVRIYNKALSPAEILQLYNGGAGTEAE